MRLDPDFGITGYTDRWHYRPGGRVALHLSAVRATDATARLWRFRRMEPSGKGGFDLTLDEVGGPLQGLDVAPQETRIGSWFEATLPASGARGLTLALLVCPTAIADEGSGLCALEGPAGALRLTLAPGGALHLDGRPTGCALAIGEWSALVLALAPDGTARLTVRGRAGTVTRDAAGLAGPFTRLALAEGGAGRAGFEGRIEAPALWEGALEPDAALAAQGAVADGRRPDPAPLAAWDFSRGIGSHEAPDTGPGGHHGRLMNLPARAVKGSRWSGAAQDWKAAPRDYAAVHFHRDDLADAGWPAAGHLELPTDLQSGLYLIEVAGPAGRDVLPVFVTPPPDARGKAPLALVASTFTYLAYANDRCLLHGANPEVLANRLLMLTPGDCELAAHPEYGLSLYDTHADGSGVAFATRRRPCLTLRHNQRAWQAGVGSGLWNFGADLLILSWLDREGLECEIVTDDDLDAEGRGALAPYRCVLTGSHPEYHTGASLDAYEAHLERGGRLIYLGGNGFYWRVATSVHYPETLELRRAEDGNRSWAAEPGEYYHAFDGAYGGLWRRCGRIPQALTGVGYSGQSFFRSHPFRLTGAAGDPRAAFLFAAPPAPGALFGDFGLTGGGAAGVEIDRADTALGTPAHALVLASTDALDDSFLLANEEMLVSRPTIVGTLAPQLRADLTFFETASGGAVLSTGSIAWAGSLGDPRLDNEVADLTRRAVARFLDPAPFAVPDGAEPDT